MKIDLVYEIGTEEIPASYLPPAVRQLEALAKGFLSEAALSADGVEAHATPRRLVLFVRGLPNRQADRTEEVTGPPWKAAFTPDGKPTKAAEGFARGRGLSVSDLRQVETERGPYVAATVEIEGKSTLDLLSDALPQMTASLAFPKTMRWGPARFRFARPIRWLLALLGEAVVPFEIEGVPTGRLTYGHRILAKGPFEVASASDYEAALERGGVVLRAEERARRIRQMLQAAAARVGGECPPAPELVEEVSYLVESPTVFAGSFDEEFLELPPPVVVTAMREHQRYFAVRERGGGKLLPRFLCVANSSPATESRVVSGNERVLRARLDDARFYWREDRKSPLEEKVRALDRVIWLEGFGTLGEKTQRIGRLAGALASRLAPAAVESAQRAGLLAKADLVTEMIRDGKEFTSLQGVIGREYARSDGEPEEVARALEEQYLPRFAGDDLPRTEAGMCLALADRLDTLVGVWAAGLRPTGSKDPFALRRGTLGVIRILLARGADVSLEELLAEAAEGYGSLLKDPEQLVRETTAFVRDRLAGHLVEEEGLDADVVGAVLPAAGANPVDARARAAALCELRAVHREDFEHLAVGFKRARNILRKDSASGAPRADLLAEPAEKALFDVFYAIEREVAAATSEHRYREAFAALARLRSPIDAFFDHVLVLAEDEKVRRNRLRLLGRIVDRIRGLADLSRIAPAEEHAS